MIKLINYLLVYSIFLFFYCPCEYGLHPHINYSIQLLDILIFKELFCTCVVRNMGQCTSYTNLHILA